MSSISPSAERVGSSNAIGRASFATGDTIARSGLAVAAGASWLLLAFITLRWPDLGDWGRGPELAIGASLLGVALIIGGLFGPVWDFGAARLRRSTPWLLALGLFFSAWQATTAKLGVLPQPFFPPPHAILEVFIDDWAKLGESVVASIKLELLGFLLGAGAGFVTGVLLGWSRAFGYWVHPLMRPQIGRASCRERV